MSNLPGDYLQIFQNDTLMAQGRVLKMKNNIKDVPIDLISFDNKLFFNLNHKEITYKEINYCEQEYFFDFKITLYNEFEKYPNEIVYMDFDINQVDEQIKPLVEVMNNLSNDLYTIGSCCGHNKVSPWIDFACRDFQTLRKFLNIFCFTGSKDFRHDWIICSNYLLSNDFPEEIRLRLTLNDKGEIAYQKIDKLAQYLAMIGNI